MPYEQCNESEETEIDAHFEKSKEFYASSPTISDQLPITLSNGFKISELSMQCPYCMQPALQSRGIINKSFKDIVLVNSISICQNCSIFFPVNSRIKPKNKRFVIQMIREKQWVEYDANASFFEIICYKIRKYAESIKSKLK